MSNDEKWARNYLMLHEYVKEHGHFPDKHNKLLNWVKYQRKRIKAGRMPEQQSLLFQKLCQQRSNEHTGGRRKNEQLTTPTLPFSDLQ